MSANSPPRHFTNASATNFYYSFIFLPREKQRAIEAVYAFARRGDDISDGDLPREEAVQELSDFRLALDRCYSGDVRSADPALEALADTVRRYRIPRRHFDDLILGLEMDLSQSRYETFDELALYCYRVASTIGLISIEIFGYQNARTRDYAINLGMALQLVNILRDVESDGRRGRIYLPGEDLGTFGLQPRDLLARKYNDAFVKLMQFECHRARRYFDAARQALQPEDQRSMIAAEIMGAIYWKVLKRIQERAYNVFGKRVRLSRPQKFWTALSVYVGADWHR